MKKIFISLSFALMLISQDVHASDALCLEKIQDCKEAWHTLNPEKLSQEACDKCSKVCSKAQKECTSQTKTHLQTANAYLLGCKTTCSAQSR